MPVRPWPELRDEDRWLIAAMEERLEEPHQSAVDLRARALELRERAKQSDVQGFQHAALALAERFEEAASRVATG